MYPLPGSTLPDKLLWIVEFFCKTIAADPRMRWLGPVSIPLWNRVKRLQRRFAALYGMWKAGTLPKGRSVRAVAAPPPRPSPASAGEGANGADGAMAALTAQHTRPA